tara:strand:+ start:5380 stop:6177 length:798 start_codon:yes stop_codon:yes gene_type:complete
MDGIAKHLSSDLPVIQVIWARYFFMVLMTIPVAYIFFKNQIIFPKKIKVQILRSIFLFLSTVLFFYSFSILSLPEALTLAFIHPLITTLFSSLTLKEKVGINRWIAVIIGFIGALIVLRPGFESINLASLAALGAGVCYGFFVLTTRTVSSTDSPVVTLIFAGIIGTFIISFFVIFVWINPNFYQWILMICLALAGTIGHLFLIISLKYAEASKLAPLGYFEIVSNAIIGYYFFSDLPNIWVWIGLIIIIISGLYLTLKENNNKN